jgi:uncharacterized lipoprotein YbaY
LSALLLVAAAALCACGNRGNAPETRLFGVVTFREAAALPAGARLEVRIEDMGRTNASGALQQGGEATSLATQAVDAGGRGPPISFTLSVPRDALQSRHRYVLRAEIRSSTGELLFTGRPDQPPISNPNTTGRIELTVIPASR